MQQKQNFPQTTQLLAKLIYSFCQSLHNGQQNTTQSFQYKLLQPCVWHKSVLFLHISTNTSKHITARVVYFSGDFSRDNCAYELSLTCTTISKHLHKANLDIQCGTLFVLLCFFIEKITNFTQNQQYCTIPYLSKDVKMETEGDEED